MSVVKMANILSPWGTGAEYTPLRSHQERRAPCGKHLCKGTKAGGFQVPGRKAEEGSCLVPARPPPQGLPTPAGVAGSPRICRGEASRDRRAGQDPPQSGAPLSVPSSGRAQSKHSRPHKLMPGIRWLGRWRDSGNLLKVQCLPEDSTHVLSR